MRDIERNKRTAKRAKRTSIEWIKTIRNISNTKNKFLIKLVLFHVLCHYHNCLTGKSLLLFALFMYNLVNKMGKKCNTRRTKSYSPFPPPTKFYKWSFVHILRLLWKLMGHDKHTLPCKTPRYTTILMLLWGGGKGKRATEFSVGWLYSEVKTRIGSQLFSPQKQSVPEMTAFGAEMTGFLGRNGLKRKWLGRKCLLTRESLIDRSFLIELLKFFQIFLRAKGAFA